MAKIYFIFMLTVSEMVVSQCGVILRPRGVQQTHISLGYSYPLSLPYIAASPVATNYFIKQVPEKTVSYSLAYKDYLYLKKHKEEGGSPFDPEPIHEGPNYLHVENYHHSQYKDKHVETPSISADDTRVAASEVLESSVGSNVNIDHSIPAAALVKPIVTKHIYFHVPSPEIEEQPRVPIVLTPQKKRYNIIFIKAPSQEPKYAQLQQILQNRSPDEQKTLIYVLSKQQEQSMPVVLPQTKAVSAPEVYFIKYKVNPRDGAKINSELGETSFLQSVSPLLEPRLGQDKP